MSNHDNWKQLQKFYGNDKPQIFGIRTQNVNTYFNCWYFLFEAITITLLVNIETKRVSNSLDKRDALRRDAASARITVSSLPLDTITTSVIARHLAISSYILIIKIKCELQVYTSFHVIWSGKDESSLVITWLPTYVTYITLILLLLCTFSFMWLRFNHFSGKKYKWKKKRTNKFLLPIKLQLPYNYSMQTTRREFAEGMDRSGGVSGGGRV